MALIDKTIVGSGSVRVHVAGQSTGAELTVQSDARNVAVAVFTGGPSLLEIAGKCAAIAADVNDGEQYINLYSGFVDFGTSREGELTLTPNGDGTVTVTLVNDKDDQGSASAVLTVRGLAEVGQLAGAAGHDL